MLNIFDNIVILGLITKFAFLVFRSHDENRYGGDFTHYFECRGEVIGHQINSTMRMEIVC